MRIVVFFVALLALCITNGILSSVAYVAFGLPGVVAGLIWAVYSGWNCPDWVNRLFGFKD